MRLYREWHAGGQPRTNRRDSNFHRKPVDRRRQSIWAILRRVDRRSSRLQPRVERKRNSDRHEFAGRQSATTGGNAVAGTAAGAPLTAAKLRPLVNEAISRWRSALGNTLAVQNLSNVRVNVMDLPNTTLGLSSGNFIFVDKDAAGHGWFVDQTPHNDSEFASGHVSAAVKGKVDLLSVLIHEFGHILGMDDVHVTDPNVTNNVMADILPLGVRRSAFNDTSAPATSHPAAERAVDSLLADTGLDVLANRKTKRVR